MTLSGFVPSVKAGEPRYRGRCRGWIATIAHPAGRPWRTTCRPVRWPLPARPVANGAGTGTRYGTARATTVRDPPARVAQWRARKHSLTRPPRAYGSRPCRLESCRRRRSPRPRCSRCQAPLHATRHAARVPRELVIVRSSPARASDAVLPRPSKPRRNPGVRVAQTLAGWHGSTRQLAATTARSCRPVDVTAPTPVPGNAHGKRRSCQHHPLTCGCAARRRRPTIRTPGPASRYDRPPALPRAEGFWPCRGRCGRPSGSHDALPQGRDVVFPWR